MSMNAWMNPINAWAPDSRAMPHPTKNFRIVSDILKASDTWVTIDENPASINDGWFVCDPRGTGSWVDIPGTYHNGAGGLSYADGHSEIKKWSDQAIRAKNAVIGWDSATPAFVLQTAAVLGAATKWSDWSFFPYISGNSNVVVVPEPDQNQVHFFRARQR